MDVDKDKAAATQAFRNRAVGVVWLALFCDYLLMTIAIPIFPELGVSDFEVGVLFSAKAAVQVISSPFVAAVVDRHGLKPLIGGLLVELISSICFTFYTRYAWWFAMRAIQGLASAAILSCGFLHVQRAHEGDNRALGNGMSTVITGIISGVMIGPPIGGVLFDAHPDTPFYAIAGLLAVSMACTFAHDRAHPGWHGAAPSTATPEVDDGANPAGGGGCDSGGDGGGGGHVGAGGGDDGGGGEGERTTRAKAYGLLCDKHVAVVLGSLLFANAAISCLEATCGQFLKREHGLGASEVGLAYMATAGPSVLGSKLGGWLGNRNGRWKVMLWGMVLQGVFYALGPKNEMAVVLVSFVGAGLGMGLVDGTAPAMLSDVGTLYHDGTGVVFTLQTAAIQVGFIVGPVCGSALMQTYSFQSMSFVLGGLMVLFSPLLLINRRITEELALRENQEKAQGGNAKVAQGEAFEPSTAGASGGPVPAGQVAVTLESVEA
eukprot:g292.t1